ncbi:efflux RND transporter periplasmic adaptor subunit [Bowmanella dokdonensis]|uniref:Efflux RND transporter periplasmic adaptor subunit n=1 Tax=Bowmanella dokdonensis TaxID=751969 RepID=A0A939IRM4_9ALTE|nr:efflux RND transporter periplasmic adaptor subunit [Bowmanella dokdonensis]MBN7826244.1 efflux RND transporter periplasmic adaptor subunit [Bowmanella dokdonensis]
MTNLIRNAFTSLWLALMLLPALPALASGDHGHGDEHEEQTPVGPHGGKLLSQGELTLEITFYEIGVAPQMRVYAYQDEAPLPPDSVGLAVVLNRLGGEPQTLDFHAEQDYQVSNQSVGEPHSFDVTVTANWQDQRYQWDYEQYEGRTRLSDRAIRATQLQTESAGPGQLEFKQTLFGVIAPTTDRRFVLMSPYQGVVEQVMVSVGDQVRKGQPLVRVRNSQTLQRFTIDSPASGQVTEQWVNAGELAGTQGLLEITDLSRVWVELSAFPENIEQMAVGQVARVYDLHHHLEAEAEVFYLAPMMTGGHIARARLAIDNPQGHWRPGMHVKADIITGNKAVALRVSRQAIQQLFDKPVVFARYGNVFEARPLELGQADGDWVEVLNGLQPGTEYVTTNSYVLKADVLKAGASHAH